jgi:hypothetical protein
MRKRLGIAFGVVLLTVAGIIAGLIWFANTRDPVYQGKPLSAWLEAYNDNPPPSATRHEADEALRHLGTNALPALLRRMRAKDTAFKNRWFALVQKQHLIRISHTTAMELHLQSYGGFTALGPP